MKTDADYGKVERGYVKWLRRKERRWLRDGFVLLTLDVDCRGALSTYSITGADPMPAGGTGPHLPCLENAGANISEGALKNRQLQ